MSHKKCTLKHKLAWLLLMLPLAGCQKKTPEPPPMYVGGQPVHTVPFTQPLEINPGKEQTFYFRFKKPQDRGETITVFAVPVFPSYFDKNGDIPKYLKYKDLDKKLVDNQRLKFKIAIRHYDDSGKETAVGLREGSDVDYIYYQLQQRRQDKSKPARFESDEQYFNGVSVNTIDTRQVNGQTYLVDNIIVASFPVQEEGGYYKLMVTPLQRYPDYPELILDIKVGWPSNGK